MSVLDRGGSGGGNRHWKCKYCPLERTSSYTRVEGHLLQLSNKGIALCRNVRIDVLSQMERSCNL
uniref:Uncharacterized protein n=1 Tax=Arundo donax TaxID=35708 RepID=A0A0A9GR60_ARUDO